VADRSCAGEFVQNVWRENFFDFAHGAVSVEFVAVGGNNTGGFLAAMLECVETEVDEFGCFGVAEDSDDTAVVVEVVVEELVHGNHAKTFFTSNFARTPGKYNHIPIKAIRTARTNVNPPNPPLYIDQTSKPGKHNAPS
jgi:hypothetical protein